jgi:hypothetical protein
MFAAVRRWAAEWLWRMAVLAALGWIGWELHALRLDVNQAPDEQATIAAAPDDTQDTLDAIRDDLESLTQKVDAILVVMARSR